MGKIDYARFADGKERISIENLSNRLLLNPMDEIVHELLCPECDCQLSFVQKTERRVAFLRTKSKHTHNEDCVYKLMENRMVPSKHLKDKLVGMPGEVLFKRLHRFSNDLKRAKKLSNDGSELRKKVNIKKSNTTKTTTELDKGTDIKIKVSLKSYLETNQKVPSIRHRDIAETQHRENIGIPMLVYGYLESIEVWRNKINDPVLNIYVKSYNTEKIYQVQSTPELFLGQNNLESIFKKISENIKKIEDELLVTLSIETYLSKDTIIAPIYDSNHICIDGYSVEMFNYRISQNKYVLKK